MYRLNEAEQREVYKKLVAEPASVIRDAVIGQLSEVDRIETIRADPRRELLQSYLNAGDKLSASESEPDRVERRKQYALAFMLGLAILDDLFQTDGSGDMYYMGGSAIGRYLAAARRCVVSMTMSVKYLDDEALEFAARFLTPNNIWILGLIVAGVAIAAFWGGWVAFVINGLLYVVGVWDLVQRFKEGKDSVEKFAELSLNAKDDADLDRAARYFAKAVSLGILTLFELWVLHKTFGAIRSGFAQRFGRSQALETSFGERLRSERAKRKADAEREKTEDTSDEGKADKTDKADEGRDERDRADENDRDTDRSKSEGKGDAVKAIGGKRLADDLGDGDGWAVLAVVGLGLGLAVAASRGRR